MKHPNIRKTEYKPRIGNSIIEKIKYQAVKQVTCKKR